VKEHTTDKYTGVCRHLASIDDTNYTEARNIAKKQIVRRSSLMVVSICRSAVSQWDANLRLSHYYTTEEVVVVYVQFSAIVISRQCLVHPPTHECWKVRAAQLHSADSSKLCPELLQASCHRPTTINDTEEHHASSCARWCPHIRWTVITQSAPARTAAMSVRRIQSGAVENVALSCMTVASCFFIATEQHKLFDMTG